MGSHPYTQENSFIVEYSIPIYPKERETKLIFSSLDEKNSYLRKEWNYCLKVRNDYVTSPSSKIKECKKAYDEKRVLFATKMGYGPKKHDVNKWVKIAQKNNEPKDVA
jgi:hypothetical protein